NKFKESFILTQTILQSQDASYGYEIIEELANIPDFGIYVIVTNFYKAYFQGNKKQSQQILDFLNQNGLNEISSRLP
ncbi:MAG: hypothetical protein N4R48_10255, partial [Lactobacillus crispatus]|nr:hypothetical protein [Lactobacillus crispatus]MCT7697894.1 hypothetical protein [Lactobacillus crispatus]MCT7709371.1 hypothetical protein [Lactobacillus crispatus]MCT7740705.1 hypothetical protein [Lactobacillus crispatus]MCT7760296.1 hypothetical protein [Lactobacillus crispatus]